MTDLGMPSGYTGTPAGYTSIANDINNAGQVAGYSHTAEYVFPFITGPHGVEITDLGTLGGTTYSGGSGIDDAEHAGINDAGQVVGYSNTSAGPQHAFITGPNGVGMTDLNSFVSPGSPGLINNAIGINNHGQILVTVSGVPEPETYAMFLAGLALVAFMARLRRLPSPFHPFQPLFGFEIYRDRAILNLVALSPPKLRQPNPLPCRSDDGLRWIP
jgi:probable HAF family extracellular repeat protein